MLVRAARDQVLYNHGVYNAGDEIEMTIPDAEHFLREGLVEELVPVGARGLPDYDALTLADLRHIASERAVELHGAKTKADVIAELRKADRAEKKESMRP